MIGRLTASQTEMFLTNPRFSGIRFPDISKPETIEAHFRGQISYECCDILTV